MFKSSLKFGILILRPDLVHQIINKCLYFCPIFLSSSLNFFAVTNAMAVKLILNKEKYHQKFKDTYLQLEALVKIIGNPFGHFFH